MSVAQKENFELAACLEEVDLKMVVQLDVLLKMALPAAQEEPVRNQSLNPPEEPPYSEAEKEAKLKSSSIEGQQVVSEFAVHYQPGGNVAHSKDPRKQQMLTAHY